MLLEGRLPESWIPPAHVVEMRALGRLYCALMDERRAWQQRIHAQLFYQAGRHSGAAVAGRGDTLARAELSAVGRQYVDAALGALVSSAPRSIRCEHNWPVSPRPGGVSGAATRASGTRLDRRFRVDLAVPVDY